MGFNLAGVFHMFCNQLSLIYALNPGQIVCCTPGGRQRDIQSPRGIEACYILLHSTLPFMMTHFRATSFWARIVIKMWTSSQTGKSREISVEKIIRIKHARSSMKVGCLGR